MLRRGAACAAREKALRAWLLYKDGRARLLRERERDVGRREHASGARAAALAHDRKRLGERERAAAAEGMRSARKTEEILVRERALHTREHGAARTAQQMEAAARIQPVCPDSIEWSIAPLRLLRSLTQVFSSDL